MKYRKLDENRDYTFGRGSSGFLIDSPETVVQAVETRLELVEGEWFMDQTEGTPYYTEILGKGTGSLYDSAIKSRISGTQGVTALNSYQSQLNDTTRHLSVSGEIDTIYGVTELNI